MLHADEPDHVHHVEAAGSDHDQIADNQSEDMEQGTLADDHHGPTAMTVASAPIETPVKLPSNRHPFADAAALRSWPIAPPPEPPSA